MPTTIEAPESEAAAPETSFPQETVDMIDRVLGENAAPEASESEAGKSEAVEEIADESTESEGRNEESEAGHETKPAETIAAAQPAVDPELATRAIRAGLHYQDVVSFPNAQALERAVASLERATAGQTKPAEQEQEKPAELKLPDPLDPTLHDEKEIERDNFYRETIKTLHDQLGKVNESLGQFGQHQQQQQINERVSWFDEQVSKLGEDFEEYVGKGRVNEVSQQFVPVRSQLLAMTDMFQANWSVSKEQAFAMAKNALFGDHIEKLATRKVQQRIKERSKQRAGTGSNRSNGLSNEPSHNGELAKDPVLKAKYAEYERENGNA
jgi:hypothetical protein